MSEEIVVKEQNEIELKDGEKKSPKNRKDMVKNFAIGFLSVMLVLTFFSNTIMNYSLPQVATRQIMGGSISPQIRGTGTVTAEDPYNVTLKETRKISGVAVKEGAHVQIGDVIYYLEDKESTELTEAREKLDEMELTYEQSLFSGDIPNSVITNVRNGKNTTYDTYQNELNAAVSKYEAALDADNAVQADIDYMTQEGNLQAAINNYNAATPDYLIEDIKLEIADAEARGDTDKVNELARSIAALTRDKSQLGTYGAQNGYSNSGQLAELNKKKARTADRRGKASA